MMANQDSQSVHTVSEEKSAGAPLDWKGWLRALNAEILKKDSHPYCCPETRRLTDEELDRVMGIVVRHELPVVMFNLNTSIGCAIYDHPVDHKYPGISPKDLEPDMLLWLSASHLPLSEAWESPDRTLWSDGWRVFSKISHTDANRELCRSCGLEEPKDAGYYAY